MNLTYSRATFKISLFISRPKPITCSLPICTVQSSDGLSDATLVRKVLAPAGLEPPDDEALNSTADDAHATTVPTSQSATSRLFASTFANKPVNPTIKVPRRSKHGKSPSASGAFAASAAASASTSGAPSSGAVSNPTRKAVAPGTPGARERFLSDGVDEAPGTAVSSSSGGGSGGRGGGFPVGVASSKPVPMAGLVEVDIDDTSSGRPSGPVGGQGNNADSGPIDGPSLLSDAATRVRELEGEDQARESMEYDDDDGDVGVSSTVGTVGIGAAGVVMGDSGDVTGDDILSALRSMEVTNPAEDMLPFGGHVCLFAWFVACIAIGCWLGWMVLVVKGRERDFRSRVPGGAGGFRVVPGNQYRVMRRKLCLAPQTSLLWVVNCCGRICYDLIPSPPIKGK